MSKPNSRWKLGRDGDSTSQRRDVLPWTLFVVLVAGLCGVALGSWFQPGYHFGIAMVWSLGCAISGVLLGFLFGIPRTPPSGTVNVGQAETVVSVAAPAAGAGQAQVPAPAPAPPPRHATAADSSPSEINSNLVEVSDWLTKIIVGVGLVELKNLPTYARDMASFVAPSLGIADNIGIPVAGSIMLFFSVFGFLAGYLLTRIYLAVVIKKADIEVKQQNEVQLGSGKRIEVGELTRLQQDAIAGLQETVTQLVMERDPAASLDAQAASGQVAAAAAAHPHRILWVDDNPHNNTLLVEQLEREQISVDQVGSTEAAMGVIAEGKYQAVITDMARLEGKFHRPDAGVQLITAIKGRMPEMPVLVFCSRRTADRYGEDAKKAGARVVTTSGTTLIAEVMRALVSPSGGSPP